MTQCLKSGTRARGRAAFCLPLPPAILAWLAMCLFAAQMPLFAASISTIEYNRDIRPILSENCFSCHGPDSAARKAGLRLDHFDDATAPRKDKQPAIVPGKPAASDVMHRINATDDDIMPP